MTEAKKTHKVGDVVDCKAGDLVIRPDDTRHTMGSTFYVLDAIGTHDVAGTEYVVK